MLGASLGIGVPSLPFRMRPGWELEWSIVESPCGLCTATALQSVHFLNNGADPGLHALNVISWLVFRCRLPNFAHVLDDRVDSVPQALKLDLVSSLNGTPLLQGSEICA